LICSAISFVDEVYGALRGLMHCYPTLAADHPTDQDPSVGTPVSRKDGAPGVL
jgi:hypothetical protein